MVWLLNPEPVIADTERRKQRYPMLPADSDSLSSRDESANL